MTPTFNKCAYRDCKNTYRTVPGISFHRFPKNEMAVDWIIRCGNDNLLDLPVEKLCEKRLCSAHFDEKYFIPTNRGKRRLTHGALPNITWIKDDASDGERRVTIDELPENGSSIAENDNPSNSTLQLASEDHKSIPKFDPDNGDNKADADSQKLNRKTFENQQRIIQTVDECCQVNPNDFIDDDVEMDELNAVNLNSGEENPKDLDDVLRVSSTNIGHKLPANIQDDYYITEIDNNIDRDHCYYQPEIKSPHPLAKRVIKLTKELEKSRQLIEKLKKRTKPRLVTRDSVLRDARNFLNKHQLMLLNMQLKQATKTNPLWTTSEQCFAISLYAISPRAYKFLKNKKQMGLPSEDFIKEWATKLNIKSEKLV